MFLDINRNGIADAGEPSTTTDLSGRYALDYSGVTGSITGLPVVVTGGVDSDTGFAFAGKIAAQVESARQAQVVTPLNGKKHVIEKVQIRFMRPKRLTVLLTNNGVARFDQEPSEDLLAIVRASLPL